MIPESLRKFFWDVDPFTLDEEKHKHFILERLLELGNDEAIAWVMRHFPPDDIIEVVKTSRKISRRTANLWMIYYGFKKEEVRCMREPSMLRPGQ